VGHVKQLVSQGFSNVTLVKHDLLLASRLHVVLGEGRSHSIEHLMDKNLCSARGVIKIF